MYHYLAPKSVLSPNILTQNCKIMLNIPIVNRSKHPLPAYATALSAGMDLRANLDQPVTLAPLQRCLVPTGLYIALPEGYEAQIRPRSGLALKRGITVLNSPGPRRDTHHPRQPLRRAVHHRGRRTHRPDGHRPPRAGRLATDGLAGRNGTGRRGVRAHGREIISHRKQESRIPN